MMKIGEMFCQQRKGEDYFARCMVKLAWNGEMEIECLRVDKEMEFNRGLDVVHFTEIQLKKKNDMFIIRVDIVEETPLVHFLCQDEAMAVEWVEALTQAKKHRELLELLLNGSGEDCHGRISELLQQMDATFLRELNIFHLLCKWFNAKTRIGHDDISLMSEMIQLDRNAPGRKDPYGALPLHYLMNRPSWTSDHESCGELVMLVVEAHPNGVMEQWKTKNFVGFPFHLACETGIVPITQALLSLDCPSRRMSEFLGEPDILIQTTHTGQTALHILMKKLETENDPSLQSLAMILLSLEPLSLLYQDQQGNTPLHYCTESSIMRSALDFREGQMALKLQNVHSKTPLQVLSEKQIECARAGNSTKLHDIERCLFHLRMQTMPRKKVSSCSGEDEETKNFSSNQLIDLV